MSVLGKGGRPRGRQATQMWKTDCETRGHSRELYRTLWRIAASGHSGRTDIIVVITGFGREKNCHGVL